MNQDVWLLTSCVLLAALCGSAAIAQGLIENLSATR